MPPLHLSFSRISRSACAKDYTRDSAVDGGDYFEDGHYDDGDDYDDTDFDSLPVQDTVWNSHRGGEGDSQPALEFSRKFSRPDPASCPRQTFSLKIDVENLHIIFTGSHISKCLNSVIHSFLLI